jgi:DNA-binding Lrp family transcriptional regulator
MGEIGEPFSTPARLLSRVGALISACILIRTERGRMEELARKLKQIPEIKRAFPVLGRYDIIADVEAANGKQLAHAVTKTMRLGGIVFTETLPEVEE